ncbi:MAG TPA: hypothetical protein VF739_08065, partial [Ktedonobacterales bacterium]
AARVQLAGDIDETLRAHKRLVGPRADPAAIASLHNVIEASHTDRQTTLLVRLNGQIFDPAWQQQDVSLEDITLAYLGRSRDQLTMDAPMVESAALASTSDGRDGHDTREEAPR